MPDAPSNTPTGLTRSEVARQLGVSTSSVRRLEWDKLHPTQDERGIWRFDPDEVAALPPRSVRVTQELGADPRLRDVKRRGRLAARVFLMFARHRSLAEIVVATKQPPEVIRDLYGEWSITLEEAEWDRRDRMA